MAYLSGLFVTALAAVVAVWVNDTFKIGAELSENHENSNEEKSNEDSHLGR